MSLYANAGFLVDDDGKQAVINYVWDTGTLAWVVQNASGGGAGSDVNVTNTSIPVTQLGAWSVGLSQYSPNAGRLPVLADINGTVPVSVAATINANPTTYNGKALTYVSVDQGAAGTTVLAAASALNKHKILGCFLVMDAAGTLKFNDGTVDRSGAMSIAANGGFVLPTSIIPFAETAAINRPLNLITTAGKAAGTVVILTEP